MLKHIPLVPKVPGSPLHAIILGRLSKPKNTEEETQQTIESSYAFTERFLADVYKGPIETYYLGEQVSGYVADRPTILEAVRLMNTGTIDVVISEDLSRVSRNPAHQHSFVQDCVDAKTRLICIADGLDTADDNWEMMLSTAALRHGLYVPDTRRRVKRTATHAFNLGGMVLKCKAGYLKLSREKALTGEFGPEGLRIMKDPVFSQHIPEIRRQLMKTGCLAKVVRWLNKKEIPTGPYAKGDKWNRNLLKGLLRDPILHGTRSFRKTLYVQIYKTGHYDREVNGNPERDSVPELSYMTLEEQDSMLDAVGLTIDWGVEDETKQQGPRKNVRVCQSYFPGQSATCGICGGRMLIFGHFLKCTNSLELNGQTCWNHVQVDIQRTRDTLLSWVLEEFSNDSDARRLLIDAAWKESQLHQKKQNSETSYIEKELKDLLKQQENLSKAIANGGELEGLLTALQSVEARIVIKRKKLKDAVATTSVSQQLLSRELVDAHAYEALKKLMAISYDFADVMRAIFPKFVIQPIQALDTGQVYPRGKLVFSPSGSDEDDCEQIEVELDLFRLPDPLFFRPQILELKAQNPKLSYKKIGKALGIGYMSVKRSFAYQHLMDEHGETEPYREIHEEPSNVPRWGKRKPKAK
ncbi:MAG: hypothetical protein COA78_35480 [Blastopirellula sp.]|nr:MAG: hypothetical protein COA78_35480 [Blastopirellula sp.]